MAKQYSERYVKKLREDIRLNGLMIEETVARVIELQADLKTEAEEIKAIIRERNLAHEVIVEQALELSALRRRLKNKAAESVSEQP